MKFAIAVVISCMALASPASGQSTPEQTQKRLDDRNAAPKRKVEITAGELDDLKAEIASFRDQVDQLKKDQPGQPAPVPSTQPRPKTATTLEVGMTCQEMLAFLKARRTIKVLSQ